MPREGRKEWRIPAAVPMGSSRGRLPVQQNHLEFAGIWERGREGELVLLQNTCHQVKLSKNHT